MTQRLDLQNWLRFGRLILTWDRETRKWKIWEKCLCDCWNYKRVMRGNLLSWNTTSCWCFQKEFAQNLMTKHWYRYSRIYKIFKWMNDRCKYKSNASYKNYGWRWIVCERKTFEEFKDDMYESYLEHVKKFWEKQTTIDRIDANWNYCKDNCRWATYSEQNRNKR